MAHKKLSIGGGREEERKKCMKMFSCLKKNRSWPLISDRTN